MTDGHFDLIVIGSGPGRAAPAQSTVNPPLAISANAMRVADRNQAR
jgi:hypothetical protein